MVIPLILHYNTPEHTTNLCRELPTAIVIANCENHGLDVPNTIISLGQNWGFSEGWNKGIRAVMGMTEKGNDYYWLCNSDIIPYRDCLEKLYLATKLNSHQIFTANYNCWNEAVRHLDGHQFRDIRFIEFTAPVISRSVFEKIGFFDSENFNNGYGVEYDFCYRAFVARIKTGIYDPAEFYHIRKQSINQLDDPEGFEKVGNQQQRALYTKHANKALFGNVVFQTNRNQRAAVYTTIFGKYDTLKSVPDQSVDVDYVCICDQIPDAGDMEAKKQWKIVQVQNKPIYNGDARMNAKHYKLMPHDCPELAVYDNLIFIDASFQIIHRDFVRFCLSNLTTERFTVAFHKARNNIYDEAMLSARLEKYRGQNVIEQANSYRQKGFTNQVALYECGLLVRNMRSRNVKELCRTWLQENIKFTYQDQISFPFVCWIYKFTPASFTQSADFQNLWQNKYFKITWNPKK